MTTGKYVLRGGAKGAVEMADRAGPAQLILEFSARSSGSRSAPHHVRYGDNGKTPHATTARNLSEFNI
jgi:hypothetical protein